MVAVSDLIDTRASNRRHHAAVLGSVGLKSALVIQGNDAGNDAKMGCRNFFVGQPI